MLTFTISMLLIPYAIVMAVVIFLVFMNIKNLNKYHAEEVGSFAILVIFLAGFTLLGYFSYRYLAGISWKDVVTIGTNSMPF